MNDTDVRLLLPVTFFGLITVLTTLSALMAAPGIVPQAAVAVSMIASPCQTVTAWALVANSDAATKVAALRIMAVPPNPQCISLPR